MLSPNERLQEARLRLGKTPSEVAAAVNLPIATYYDAEEIGDELYMALSLAELRSLCEVLKIPMRQLFESDRQSPDADVTTFADLAGRVREYLQTHSMPLSDFEDKAGWVLGDFLENPEALWEWTVDEVKDVTRVLSLDWYSVLPP